MSVKVFSRPLGPTLATAKSTVVAACQWLKPRIEAGARLVLVIKTETREERHSRHFHSQIAQISDHMGGDLADREDAKRILISAYRLDTLTDPELADAWQKFGDMRMGRGLRGEVVLLGAQSRKFPDVIAKGFVHWLYAFGAEQGVMFKAWGDDF